MSYLNAPATKMLAKNCAVCARALVDAVSVETGIGPDCRQKYGYNTEVDPAARDAANKLVHEVACEQTGEKATKAADLLGALGFHKLAERILQRLLDIQITISGDRLEVVTPYNEVALPALRSIPGRQWDGEKKVNTFPIASKPALWKVLQTHFEGMTARGPKGIFTIGAQQPAPTPPAPRAPTAADRFHFGKVA